MDKIVVRAYQGLPKPLPMKTPRLTARCARLRAPALLLASLFAAAAARAQVVPPTADAKKAASAEEAVTLTPFTVSTDKDTGFAATSALAGGRLASDLRDTPVAYSVINRDFID